MIKSIKHYKENVLTRDLLLKQKSVNVMEVPAFSAILDELAANVTVGALSFSSIVKVTD